MAEPTTTLLGVVSDMLKKDGVSAIEEKVAETMFAREINKRSEAVVKVLDLISQEEKELKKIDRADIQTYDRTGKPVGEGTYSKARLEDIQKRTKKIEKLKGAINKALEKSDYGDLYNAASGKLKDDDAGGANTGGGGSEDQS